MPQAFFGPRYTSLTHLMEACTSATRSMARATATAAMLVINTARSAASCGRRMKDMYTPLPSGE